MSSPKEYTLQDAIADAIRQREAAGEAPLMSNKHSMELEALSSLPVAPTKEKMHEAVIAAIRTVYDPELPVNLYDLGLIYDIIVSDDYSVLVKMTLTAPGCPVAGEMPRMVERAVRYVNGIKNVKAELVWNPPWNKSMMSEAAQLELGFL